MPKSITAALILNSKCIDLVSVLTLNPNIVVLQLDTPLENPVIAGAPLPHALLEALEQVNLDPS